MNLVRPLSAVILAKPQQLVANKEVTIKCEVMGSRPQAVVSWIRDNRDFRRGKVRKFPMLFIFETKPLIIYSSLCVCFVENNYRQLNRM